MASRKGSYFMAVAAAGHGTPAPAMGTRGVIEKEATKRIGAHTKLWSSSFRDNFRSGPRDGRKQPIQPTLTGYKLESPNVVPEEDFVVPFRDAQDFVNRFDPLAQYGVLVDQCSEDFAQGTMNPLGFSEERPSVLWIILNEGEKLSAAL